MGIVASPVLASRRRSHGGGKPRLIRSERTMTRSFRIRETSLKALDEDAKKLNVSLNTLVNQLLASYTNFDRLFKRFRVIKVSSASFRRVLEAASQEAISEAGSQSGKNIPKTFILSWKGALSLENALEYLRLLSDYANLFEYSEVPHEGKRAITLSHELGRNGSLFI